MASDYRYAFLQEAILKKQVYYLRDIFKYVPKSVIARDLGLKIGRFNRSIQDISTLYVKHLFQLAELIKVGDELILDLYLNQYLLEQKLKERRRN